MITKTAIGLFEGGLFALPHAMGYYTGDESAGSALLNTGGDIAALKAGDALYNKIVKPKDYAFFGKNQDANGLVRSKNKPMARPKPGVQYWKHPVLAKHWGRSLGHFAGRMAVGMPLFTLSSSILTPLGDKLWSRRRNQNVAPINYSAPSTQYARLAAQAAGTAMNKTAAGMPIHVFTPTIDAAYGAGRALALAEDDRDTLIKAYRLPQDANLELRNAGRGLLGGVSGAALAAVPAALFAAPTRNIEGALPIMTLGSIVGAHLATNKYSDDGIREAKRILKKRRINGD